MPPPISDRYRLEMRLGRDGDIEEWLATDTSLERPVLIRSLGPESTVERRRQFVEMVGAAAKVSHPHLTRVFAVDTVQGGAYSVSEWTGGATLADRLAAGRMIDLEEFLPNAAGLSGALAALHATGSAHGHLDLSSISYSVAHPAKLGSFGRPAISDETGDVRSLAGLLEMAVTGQPAGGPPPSESIDGFPRSIDRILRQGQVGHLTAEELEKAFTAAPTPRLPNPEPRSTSRRLLAAAAALVLAAIGLVALGRLFVGGGRILPVTSTLLTSNSTTEAPTTIPPVEVSIDSILSFDPFGEGGENDNLIPALTDSNNATFWRTERYLAPLETIKEGVGLRLDVTGTPAELIITGLTAGTVFEVRWALAASPRPDGWERTVGATASQGPLTLELPPRTDGHWLIWMSHLPEQPDGSYQAAIAEVRFSS